MKRNPKKIGRQLSRSLSVWVVGFLAIVCLLLPLPYYIEVPGSAERVSDFVTVDGKSDEADGAFLLTTVGIRQGTAASLFLSLFSPFQEIVSKGQLMGESTSQEYDRLTAYQMASSENSAKKVALDLVGKSGELSFEGVYVMGVTNTSDFQGKLQMGDVVTEIDGQRFKSTEDFMTYIKSQRIGKEVTVAFLRDGQPQHVTGKLTKGKEANQAAIGISLVDQTKFHSETPIAIDAGNIGGPSAGLMFTLETYQLLSGENLRAGRQIAGTGTIAPDGKVGSIGGIDKKVLAASEAGATVFFAPAEPISSELKQKHPELKSNLEIATETAKKIKSKMIIVPVDTVQEAINYLKNKATS